MYQSKKVRMNRLFGNGRCLDVAIDHGVCNEPSFMDGLEDMEQVVASLAAAGPDAIQMNYGQADLLQGACPDYDWTFPVQQQVCVQGRFRVSTRWATTAEQGRAWPATAGSVDTALFWFFSETNWEVMVKVLNACAINDHY